MASHWGGRLPKSVAIMIPLTAYLDQPIKQPTKTNWKWKVGLKSIDIVSHFCWWWGTPSGRSHSPWLSKATFRVKKLKPTVNDHWDLRRREYLLSVISVIASCPLLLFWSQLFNCPQLFCWQLSAYARHCYTKKSWYPTTQPIISTLTWVLSTHFTSIPS